MTALAAATYVRLTTFTRDGQAKHTPVWIAEANPGIADGTVGMTTDVDSWKVKRIRHTPGVKLCPSDSRGRVTTDVGSVDGTAEVVLPGDNGYAVLEAALVAKYGLQYRLFRGMAKLRQRLGRSGGPCAILIELQQE